MKNAVKKIYENKNRPIPILSFPATSLLGISVEDLIFSSENQAKGMKAIADRCPVGASLNMMDLSVEAEAFGAKIKVSAHEIPTVAEPVLKSLDEIKNLRVPEVGEARTGLYVEGVKKAVTLMPDVPVLCGAIGPYSLAGRLYDMSEIMMACLENPAEVAELLEKCAEFTIKYIKAFKAVGASGVILAEPAAGLLPPDMCEEFSSVYVRKIVAAVSDEDFIFCYHNCGNTVVLTETISSIGADMYHFGNAIELEDILKLMPKDAIVMGNISPLLLRSGSVEEVAEKTSEVLEKCSKYDNFIISSGCDIPHDSSWENIDAFFEVIQKFYKK